MPEHSPPAVEPSVGDDPGAVVEWLHFHRDALARKCQGLEPAQLVLQSAPPSKLSLLGLVRHLTEMERVYGSYALGGPRGSLQLLYVTDTEPDGDLFPLDAGMTEPSFEAWYQERERTDGLIEASDLDAPAVGNSRTVRWNIMKLLQEYARHNGHADILREAIDGAVGE
jgi:hypothetical protein